MFRVLFDFMLFTGKSTVREAEYCQRHYQFRSVQVWPPASKGLADDVRLGKDVLALSKPLEAGAARS